MNTEELRCLECGKPTPFHDAPLNFCPECPYCPGCGVNPHFFEKIAGAPTKDGYGREWCADCAWKIKDA